MTPRRPPPPSRLDKIGADHAMIVAAIIGIAVAAAEAYLAALDVLPLIHWWWGVE